MEYGIKNYNFSDVLDKSAAFNPIPVKDGIPKSETLSEQATVPLEIDFEQDDSLKVLLKDGESVEPVYRIPKILKAPVKSGDVVGKVEYKLGDEVIREYSIFASKDVKMLDYKWCLHKVISRFLCGN